MNKQDLKPRCLLLKLNRNVGYGMKLMLIVSLHILIIVGNAYIAYSSINKVQSDTHIINHSGMIRGGIQKIAKLETNGIDAGKDIDEVDLTFKVFLDTDKQTLLKYNMNAFVDQMETLQNEWISLKQTIKKYHAEPTETNKQMILSQSEQCWRQANQTVEIAEALSIAKMSTFQLMFIVFFFDFLLVMGIIWLINSMVRQNLEVSSRIDPLTGIFNRNVYNEEVSFEISRSERSGYSFSILLIDIDFFKQINDDFGHDIGDKILKDVSNVISENLRINDLFYRIGGEEFIILVTETTIEDVKILGEKIRAVIERYDFGIHRTITISLGATTYTNDDTKDTLFKRADEALYISKNNGRNTITIK